MVTWQLIECLACQGRSNLCLGEELPEKANNNTLKYDWESWSRTVFFFFMDIRLLVSAEELSVSGPCGSKAMRTGAETQISGGMPPLPQRGVWLPQGILKIGRVPRCWPRVGGHHTARCMAHTVPLTYFSYTIWLFTLLPLCIPNPFSFVVWLSFLCSPAQVNLFYFPVARGTPLVIHVLCISCACLQTHAYMCTHTLFPSAPPPAMLLTHWLMGSLPALWLQAWVLKNFFQGRQFWK